MKLSERKDYFISRARKKHNNKYEYVGEYIGCQIPMEMECKIHGIFLQRPHDHLRAGSNGCKECGYDLRRTNISDLVKRFKKIHGKRYDYDIDNYKSVDTKIKIICRSHGSFMQTPSDHLRGRGCQQCVGKKLSVETIKERFKRTHGEKYSYSLYTNSTRLDKKIDIICYEHGIFRQSPEKHFFGRGCPKCRCNSVSKQSLNWLNYMKYYNMSDIRDASHPDGEFIIPGTRMRADGYSEKLNTIFEYHGDFFHGNPLKFNSHDTNQLVKRTYGELYQKTIEREERIKKLGYNLIVIWESEWVDFLNKIRTIQKFWKKCKKINK